MSHTTESFIKKAKEVHGDKYDYSKVEYKGCNEDVCIICPEHGEFWQNPSRHLFGFGCKECGIKSAAEKWNNKNKLEFEQKARKIHGDKYDYSKVDYKRWDKKVCIICPEHGEFWQTPSGHLIGHGCPECAIEKNQSRKPTNEIFIKTLKEYFGEEYDYSKVNYVNSKTKVEIICKKHGPFFILPNQIKYLKYPCPKCCEDYFKKYYTEQFISKAKKIFGDRYDYSKVDYVNFKTPACIIDENGNEFYQKPVNHLKNGIKHGTAIYAPPEPKWTYDKCLEEAKKYKKESDFRFKSKEAWYKSFRKEWIKDYTWLEKDITENLNSCKRLIYVYEFPDGHAYVGLTNNLERRDEQHRINQKHANDAVFNYGKEFNIEIPNPKILSDNLSVYQAKNEEKKFIKEYRKNGWIMLNKNGGGSIGAWKNKKKLTKEEIIEICKKYKNMEELYNKNRSIYNDMVYMKIKKECFPNAKFVDNIAKPTFYTEEMIMEKVSKYKKRSELRKNEKNLCMWLYHHNKISDYYDNKGLRKF